MEKTYAVTLTVPEREYLQRLISHGVGTARRLAHARILLKADEGLIDPAIVAAVDVSRATVERVRKRFVEEGLDAALDPRRVRAGPAAQAGRRAGSHLVALVCGTPPKGHARWTLRLLADRMVALEQLESLSYETVRRTLKKTTSSRGAKRSG